MTPSKQIKKQKASSDNKVQIQTIKLEDKRENGD